MAIIVSHLFPVHMLIGILTPLSCTHLQVENYLYKMATYLSRHAKLMKGYARILNVITKYTVHIMDMSIVCKMLIQGVCIRCMCSCLSFG